MSDLLRKCSSCYSSTIVIKQDIDSYKSICSECRQEIISKPRNSIAYYGICNHCSNREKPEYILERIQYEGNECWAVVCAHCNREVVVFSNFTSDEDEQIVRRIIMNDNIENLLDNKDYLEEEIHELEKERDIFQENIEEEIGELKDRLDNLD